MIDPETKGKILEHFEAWRQQESKQYKEILSDRYANQKDKANARARLQELYPAIGEVNPLQFGKFIEDSSDSSK